MVYTAGAKVLVADASIILLQFHLRTSGVPANNNQCQQSGAAPLYGPTASPCKAVLAASFLSPPN